MNPLAHSSGHNIAHTRIAGLISRHLLALLCAILFAGCSTPSGLRVSPEGYTGFARECYNDARAKLAAHGWNSNMGDDPDIEAEFRTDGKVVNGHLQGHIYKDLWGYGCSLSKSYWVMIDADQCFTRCWAEHETAGVILYNLGVKTEAECHVIMRQAGIPTNLKEAQKRCGGK